jgi:hypothetical protein
MSLGKKKKGQVTMFLIVLVILLFAGTAIFLLSFAKTVSQSDYLNLYTHNLLLSVMRADTGHITDPNCKLVSDAITCAFFSPTMVCRGGSITCAELANQTVADYIERFSLVKKSYRYLLTVEPQGFTALDQGTGEPVKMVIGDPAVAGLRNQSKYTANEQLGRATTTGVFNLNVRLTIASK